MDDKQMKKLMQSNKKKTTYTRKDKEEKKPIWFDTEQDVEEITKEEQNELDKLLEGLI